MSKYVVKMRKHIYHGTPVFSYRKLNLRIGDYEDFESESFSFEEEFVMALDEANKSSFQLKKKYPGEDINLYWPIYVLKE